LKINLNENKLEEYDEIFDFIVDNHPDWEKLLTDGHIKIKTNQNKVQFSQIEIFPNRTNFTKI